LALLALPGPALGAPNTADDDPSGAEATSAETPPVAGPDESDPSGTEQRVQALERELAELKAEAEARAGESNGALGTTDGVVSEEDSAGDEGEAELLALMAEDDITEYTRGDLLKFYGFMDIGFQKLFLPKNSFLYGLSDTRANTFLLGNINLFADAEPDEDWRGLFEIRFTPLPNGLDRSFESSLGTEYEREDTTVYDLTSVNGQNQVPLGGIIIERAWIQYTGSNAFQLRVGQWFTPFGIWNIDHGTPTLISLLLPGSQNSQFFPQRQIGLQALGSTYSGSWELGYQATLSNGRTYALKDLSEDKAVGGRLFARREAHGNSATIGVSGYYGTLSDESKRIVSVSPFTLAVDEVISGREWATGVDVTLDTGGLRSRSEFVLHREEYDEGKRPPVTAVSYAPDTYRWNAYTLLAYRLPWAGLEPYTWMEVVHGPSSVGDTYFVPSAGLNVYFAPHVQLKTQYAATIFRNLSVDAPGASNQHFQVLTSRLVLAF
jgi:hypothetical protein